MPRFWILLLLSVFSAAAEPADLIVTARYVVTMDAQKHVIDNGAVAIRGERVTAIGTRRDIDARFQSKSRIDAGNAIVAPGLINTHTHAAMSLFRGIADDLALHDWLEKYIFPAEAKNVNAEFVRWGTRLACLEMLLSGTTTYVDMYYFEDVVAEETKRAGMRGVLGETIIGFPVADAKTPGDSLKLTESFIQRFRNDALITPAVAPHAIYTNSDETLKASRALANKYSIPLVIHLSETKKENDDLKAKRGISPTMLLDKLGVLDGRTVAAHGVWIDANDMAMLKKHNVGVAHCPSSNMKLASGIAPVMDYLRNDVAIGLGTDGVAGSNNDVDMFEEMDLAAKLQKVTTHDPRSLNAEQAFEMATLRGARALGMDREIGSLETGKRADLIVVGLNEANAVPIYNVYSQLVYALKASDVQDVIVNGKIVVRQRRALTLNRDEILSKAAQYGATIHRSLAAK
jgi:5-methylthioadenosine/S-adenosylhomocysteine deaminase